MPKPEGVPPSARGAARRTNERTNERLPATYARPRAERIATIVATAARSTRDFRSVAEMCRASAVGLSAGAMRDLCRGEGIEAQDVRDFGRGLRIVLAASTDGGDPKTYLRMDYRTVPRFLARAGLDGERPGEVDVPEFCRRQRFLAHQVVVEEVLKRLGSRMNR